MSKLLNQLLENYFSYDDNIASSGASEMHVSEEDQKSHAVREYLLTKLEGEVGCFSWKSKLLQLLSLTIAAIPFSNVFGHQSLQVFLNSTQSSETVYQYGFTALNNLVFTIASHLAHSIYVYTEEIDAKCRENRELYSKFKTNVSLLNQYFPESDIETDTEGKQQQKLIGNIIVEAFSSALSKRGVHSLANLNDYRLPEYVFNMTIALNDYLITQQRTKDGSQNNGPMLLNETISHLISDEFSEILGSTMIKRHAISHLIRGHSIHHVKLDLTPSIASFSEIIQEVIWKYNNPTSKLQKTSVKKVRFESNMIKNDIEDTEKGKGKDKTEEEEIVADEEQTLSVNEVDRANGYHNIYKVFLDNKSSLTPFSNIFHHIGRFNQHLDGNSVVSNIYKVCSASSGSLALYNPLLVNTQLALLYRYLIAGGALLLSYSFYSLYTKVRDIKSENADIQNRLEDELKTLYAKRLIKKDVEGKYNITPPIEQIHTILRNVFILLSQEYDISNGNINSTLKAQIFAKIYTGVAEVILEENKKNRDFLFSENEIDLISHDIAHMVASSLGSSTVSTLASAKTPHKYSVLHGIYVEVISDITRANIEYQHHNPSWAEVIKNQSQEPIKLAV